jgi:hypothetical protein
MLKSSVFKNNYYSTKKKIDTMSSKKKILVKSKKQIRLIKNKKKEFLLKKDEVLIIDALLGSEKIIFTFCM